MTDVAAGWVVYGKVAGAADDYRVLRSSRAYFSRADYDAILRRFAPGTPPPRVDHSDPASLPWATVSYAPLRPMAAPVVASERRAEPTVLGLGVCDWTDLADAAGRRIAATTYLCAPFTALASVATTYSNLLNAIRWDPGVAAAVAPDASGSTAAGLDTVPLAGLAGLDAAAVAQSLSGDELRLAAGVAGLLLCQPVALLGASAAHGWRQMTSRLAFFDAVAALLPYGQRARLVASTWADAGSGHRIRLAYTDRARPGDAVIRLPGPGQPARLPPLPPPAADYVDVLLDLHERQGVPVEQIIAHLAAPAYRAAREITDPRHALLSLADLPGPTYFASLVLKSSSARATDQRPGGQAGEQRAETLAGAGRLWGEQHQRAVLEDVTETVALLRAQRARGQLLAGLNSSARDAAVLAALVSPAVRGGAGRVVAMELVRLAVHDDALAATTAPAGTAHTAGWIDWLRHELVLDTKVRDYTDVVAGRPDPARFSELLRNRAPWADTRYSLAMFRLARLAGCARPLTGPLLRWLTEAPQLALPPGEQAGWAAELAESSAGTPAEEARLDVCRMLLGAGPVEPLRNRMISQYQQAYRSALIADYRKIICRHGIGYQGVAFLDRVLDGLALSIEEDGWPADPVAADDTLLLLASLVESAHRASPRLWATVAAHLGGKPKPRLRRDTAHRWSGLIRTYRPVPE